MRLTKLIISAPLLLILGQTYVQAQSIKRLKIGDPVPDIEIKNIINHATTSVRTSDFKKKLLILDFWATWCAPCVASFPKLDSLQKKFGDKIKVLSVTSEAKDKVSSFLQKMKTISKILPATATEDSVLEKLFRHRFLPHYVWINNNNVIAITGSDKINEKDIRRVIDGEEISFSVKDDIKTEILYGTEDAPTFNPSIELKVDDETKLIKMPVSNLIFYSSITTYLEGLPRGYRTFHPDIFTATNLSIFELYRVALLENRMSALNLYPGSMIVEVNDSVLYDKIDVEHLHIGGLQFADWIRKNGYCYDIKVPAELVKEKYKIMLEDLNRYFGALYGIEGVTEKRNAKYLALVRTTQEDKLATKGGPPKLETDKFSISAQNVSISKLIVRLFQPLQTYPPIVDETDYKGKIDMQLTCELSNLETLNTELKKYDLSLVEKEKFFTIPVIKLKK